MSTGQISLGIIIFYLVAMLVITVWNGHKKKQKSAEGFFLANRGVSSVLLPLTMIAAMQSTFAFLGAPGMYYTHGIPYIVMYILHYFGKLRYLCTCHVLIQGRSESEERKKSAVGRCTVSSGCGTSGCGRIETPSDHFACSGIPLYIHYAVCRGCPCEGFDEREIAVW